MLLAVYLFLGLVVIAGGRAATAVATELSRATVSSASEGISGALASLGIIRERVQIFSDRFQRGDFLLIVDGTTAQIRQAEAILRRNKISELTIFSAPDMHRN